MWNLLLGNGFFVLAMGSKKKGQKEDNYAAMQAANQAAQAISPQEQKVNEFDSQLWDIYSGKTPFDLQKLPNANVLLPLYNSAKTQSDMGRVGKGLIYSGGKGSEGYNQNLMNSIDAQNQEERNLNAKGKLEGWVGDTFNGLEQRMMGLGQSDQNRRNENFNRQAQMYQMYLQKKAQPKWWESMLSGGLQAAGQIGAAFAAPAAV